MRKLHGICILALFMSAQVFAADLNISSTNLGILKSSGEDFNYSQYYRIKEDPRFQFFNLLAFDTINEKFPLPAVPYNRDAQFGGWLRDTSGATCLNTRGLVLVRDAVSDVKYSTNGCTVASGNWNELYTGRVHYKASDIQIDHVVALKNAYMTGAHEWDAAKRCLYANYMGNNFHLLPVDGPQNLKKSDLSPSGYIPPNKNFTCEFIKDWLNVKLIWALRITPVEGDAIQKIVEDNNCDPAQFVVTAQSLKVQRDFMEEHANLCSSPGVRLESF